MADARLRLEPCTRKWGLIGNHNKDGLEVEYPLLCTIVYTKKPCWTRRTKNWIFSRGSGNEEEMHGYMLFVEMLANVFASARYPTDILKGLGGRLSVNTSAVPSNFAWKKTSPLKCPPPTERPYKQVQRKSQSNESACLSWDPEILISETPEAANEIPEIGTKFNNEDTISGIAEPSLCAINEMPSTEENVSITLPNNSGCLKKNAQLSKRKFQIWKIKMKLFSQTSSHSISSSLIRQCCSIQASLTIKRSWQPLNI